MALNITGKVGWWSGSVGVAPAGIITNGLILNLDAGNSASYPGTGTTWTDLSGQNNNGTLVTGPGNPGPTWSSTDGGIFSFDGVNDYVGIPIINFGTSDFSVSFWTKPTQSTKNDGLLGQGAYPSNTAGFIYVALRNDIATRRIEFQVSSDGGTVNYKRLNCDNSYTLNAWNFITLTYSSVSKNMFAYVNGVKKISTYVSNGAFGTTSLQNLNPNNTSGRKLSLGMYDESRTLLPFTGNIAHSFINLVTLSDAEVLQNFNVTKTRFGL